MLENMSDYTRQAIKLSKRITALAGSVLVGPIELLTAILEVPTSRARQVLSACGQEPDRLIEQLKTDHSGTRPVEDIAQVRFAPEVMAAVEIATLTARRLGHPTVGTDHLLLALLQLRGADGRPLPIGVNLNLEELERLVRETPGHEPRSTRTTISQRKLRRYLVELDPAGRDVLLHAYNNAVRYHNAFIDIEHLLLALIQVHEEKGLDIPGLRWEQVDIPEARSRIQEKFETVQESGTSDVKLTLRARKVLELARQEAYLANEKLAGPKHILLGMLGFEKGFVGEVLHTDLAIIRGKVLEQILKPCTEPPTPDSLPAIDLRSYRLPFELMATIPVEVMRRFRFVPLHRRKNIITVAAASIPDPQGTTLSELEQALGLSVRFVLASPADIDRVIRATEERQQL